jgi:hypothetical protein
MSEVLDGLTHYQELTVLQTVILLSKLSLWVYKARGCQASQTHRCKAAPIALSEESANKASVADESG